MTAIDEKSATEKLRAWRKGRIATHREAELYHRSQREFYERLLREEVE
jgi:hypothetical protein